MKPILISIIGPTAVGKTALAIQLASGLGTEIISADSRQFYRELTIGTAKPSEGELSQVPHHFINSHSIDELYSAGQFGRDAAKLLKKLFEHNPAVIMVGGSSLYLKSLWEGFDEMPEVPASVREGLVQELKENGLEQLLEELKMTDRKYYEQVDRMNGQRVIRALEIIRGTGQAFSSFRKSKQKESFYQHVKVGLKMDRELLFDRINQRMDVMIEEGLFEEAASLFAYKDHNALQTVGYSEIFGFMEGKYDQEEAIRLLKRNTRRYAKRQMTWFRKYDDIHWFEPQQEKAIQKLIESKLGSGAGD